MAIGEIKICVVGAGTMGHQIALQCATHNYAREVGFFQNV
jgi:3-hydroxyacyl-CoA dehydrogenase